MRRHLFVAAAAGDLHQIRTLLDRGVLVDKRDPWRRTALYHAAGAGQVDAVRLLLSRGADPDGGEGGTTPLIAAAEASTNWRDEPRDAALETIRVLLAAGADPNAGIGGRRTAIFDGSAEAGRLLLDSGAEVNVDGPEGVTPLMEAGRRKDLELASLLLRHGADPTARDALGETALHHCLLDIAGMSVWMRLRTNSLKSMRFPVGRWRRTLCSSSSFGRGAR